MSIAFDFSSIFKHFQVFLVLTVSLWVEGNPIQVP